VALFGKKKQPQDAIAPFWDWWNAEGRDLAEQSIDGRLDPEDFAGTMNEHVQTLGELSWQLAAGEASERVLVITSGGDPSLRPLARRVVLAGPDPDDAWSYVDARPPVADPESVVLAGAEPLNLGQVRVSARMNAGMLDVQLHHPAFADLPEQARAEITYLALDATLGEVDTELWLGEILPVELEPLDGFGLTALRSVVHDLKRQRLDADGLPTWVMLRGETSGGPLIAMVRSPLHPLTAPHLDTYVSVAVPFRDQTDGLPGSEALESLRVFEHRLGARLGNDGQVVAHLSTGGARTFHLYVDSTTSALATVKDVARSWDQGKATEHDMHDPGWQAVGHLRQ
jgi:hypothetical protein